MRAVKEKMGRSTRLSYAEAAGFEPATSPVPVRYQAALRQKIPSCGLHLTARFELATSGWLRKYIGVLIVAIPFALAACADKPPINSFCQWLLPTDFTDAGLRGLTADNKRVQIVNEQTRLRECAPAKSGLKAGPK